MKAPFVFVLFAAPALAAEMPPISPTEATSHQGSEVVVQGVATVLPGTGARDGAEVAVGNGNNDGVVLAYIPKDNLERFSNLGTLNGRVVNVTGVVEMDNGLAEIRVTSPDQFNIAR